MGRQRPETCRVVTYNKEVLQKVASVGNPQYNSLITIKLATCFDPIGSSSGLHYEPIMLENCVKPWDPNNVYETYVMHGKKLIDIWLAFRILGLEMKSDNFLGVTCILCQHIGNFKFEFRYENG